MILNIKTISEYRRLDEQKFDKTLDTEMGKIRYHSSKLPSNQEQTGIINLSLIENKIISNAAEGLPEEEKKTLFFKIKAIKEIFPGKVISQETLTAPLEV